MNPDETETKTLENKLKERAYTDPRTEYVSEQSSKARKAIKRIRENGSEQDLDEKTKENKRLYEKINGENKISKTKNEAYDFLNKFLGIDMYGVETKREIKKAYKVLDDVKKDTKELEKIINGEQTYNPPGLDEQTLLNYWSGVNPKKKGLSFLNQEYQDVTIILKGYEQNHKNNIEIYEEAIKEFDKEILNTKNKKEVDYDLFREKHNAIRLMDREKQNLEEIETDLNHYIIEKKIVENNFYEAKNVINLNKQLIDVAEISFKLIGSNMMTREGKAIDISYKKMEELRGKIDKFKGFLEEYASGKNSKAKTRFDRVNETINNSNGEKISNEIFDTNKSLYDETKSSMKAMRDTYFDKLGY